MVMGPVLVPLHLAAVSQMTVQLAAPQVALQSVPAVQVQAFSAAHVQPVPVHAVAAAGASSPPQEVKVAINPTMTMSSSRCKLRMSVFLSRGSTSVCRRAVSPDR